MNMPAQPHTSLPQRLHAAAFDNATPHPRGQPFLDGAFAALERIFDENDHPVAALYPQGAANFDAFVAGRIEGHAIAAEYLATCAVEVHA